MQQSCFCLQGEDVSPTRNLKVISSVHYLPVRQGWTSLEFNSPGGIAFRVIVACKPSCHDKVDTHRKWPHCVGLIRSAGLLQGPKQMADRKVKQNCERDLKQELYDFPDGVQSSPWRWTAFTCFLLFSASVHLSCLLILSSFSWSLCIFRLLLLALYNVLLRKCASAREKATTLVLGWLQSWGGRGWCALCMASYSAAEIHDIYTDA